MMRDCDFPPIPVRLFASLLLLAAIAAPVRAQEYNAKGFKISAGPIIADAAGEGYDKNSIGTGGLLSFGYVFGDLGLNTGYRFSNIDPLNLHVIFVNAEIFFVSADRFQVYGSAGSGYYLGKGDRVISPPIADGTGQSLNGFGINMGAGILYYLKENFALFIEPSYRVVSFKKLEENGISIDLSDTFEGDVIDIAVGARFGFR